jgi:hypothetical protein
MKTKPIGWSEPEEARTIADGMKDETAKRMLRTIAESYERMAETKKAKEV